jgi:uncharacterized membrane protein
MYLFFKLLHIVAVVAFLGNITVGVFWKNFADRTKDASIIAYTMDGIIRADRIFTIPGVILIVIGGVGTAIVGGIPFFSTGWVLWGIILFVLAGIAFGPLAGVQRQLLAAAKKGDMAAYWTLSKKWDLYGAIALVAPLLALGIMVLKPALPAFH